MSQEIGRPKVGACRMLKQYASSCEVHIHTPNVAHGYQGSFQVLAVYPVTRPSLAHLYKAGATGSLPRAVTRGVRLVVPQGLRIVYLDRIPMAQERAGLKKHRLVQRGAETTKQQRRHTYQW